MLRRLPLHPLLLAAFPVLLLWWQNGGEVEPTAALASVGRVVLGAAVATAVAGAVLRDARRGALVGSAGTFLYLSYGYLWGAERAPWVGLGLWALLLAGAVAWALRVEAPEGLARTTLGANVGAALLVALTLPGVVGAWGSAAPRPVTAPTTVDVEGRPLRDIVYIVPDRYGREDNLAATFGIDNSGFVDALEARGFAVLDETFGNYPRTSHALASTLSMEYLDDVATQVPDDARSDLTYVYPMLRDHRVGEVLTSAGYRYVHVGTWWSPTATATAAHEVVNLDRRSEFAQVLADTTLTAGVRAALGIGDQSFRERVRSHSAFQLDVLDELATEEDDRPRFVLAHVTLPHEPYVFDRDGTVVTEDVQRSRSRAENYERQLTYLNTRLLQLVDTLLAGPDASDPIVIVQADEGPHTTGQEVTLGSAFRFADATTEELRTKLRVFSAMYLPGVAEGDLPPEGMSSVNTFRYVLDTYLGTDLGLLPDRAYVYPDNDDYYSFTDVTDQVAGR